MAVNGQDIGLIFGMAGGGTLQGATGSHIKGQLSELIENLNSDAQVKQRKIKLSLDIAGTKKNFAEGLKQITDGLSSQKQFKIQVKNIDASSAIKKLRTDIQSVLDTLSIKNGMAISIPSAGCSIVGDAGAAVLDEAKEKAAQYAAQLTTIKQISSSMNKSYKSILDGAIDDVSSEKLRAITEEYTRLNLEIEKFKVNKNDPRSQEWINTIEAETAALKRNIQELLNKGSAEVSQEANTANLISGTIEYERAMKKLNDTLKQAETSHNNWTKAKNGKSSVAYDNIADEITHLKTLKAELMSGSITQEKFNAEVAGATSRLSGYYKEITTAGEATRSFSDRLGGLAAKFSTWFSLTRIIMAAFRAIKQMVTNVIELDSAMTQLQIVTGATDAKMTTFLKNATGLAKELGQSISDVLKSIETFSRLGYNLDDSSTLAKYTAILANVAAVDTQEATTGVTSIIKGFNMDVSNSEHVADVLIEVGQKYAVSAAELMEAFEKSGAALNATNTSFEKSVGLIAAANASVQNASTVGTALKTISARIRGSKSDLEELGEDTSDLTDGFSKYADELKALTGFNIMVDGTTNQFKDIYDILQGIAGVWDDLSDTQQARVSEILGGTRQLQVISSILGNWTDAAGAYQSAMESAGTAAEANATYMDSIEGRIGVFKATFQELSETLINSEFVKQIVDLGTGVLNIFNGVAKLIDAIGGLNTVLAATVGIIATIKADSILNLFTVALPTALTKLAAVFTSFSTANVGAAISLFVESVRAGNGVLTSFTGVVGAATVGINTFKLALGAATVILTGAIILFQKYKQSQEEARQAAIDSANSAAALTSEISELTGKYLELSEAVKDDTSVKQDLISTEDAIINKLGVEREHVEGLAGEYGNLTDAIKKASVEELQRLGRDIAGGHNERTEELLEAGKPSWGADAISISGSMQNGVFGRTSATTREEQTRAYQALRALEDAGLISSGSYSSYTDAGSGKKYSQGFAFFAGLDQDMETAEGVLAVYEKLGEMLDTIRSVQGVNLTDTFVYDAIYQQYNSMSDAVSNYKNSINDLNKNLTEQYMLQNLIGKEIPKDKDGFEQYRQSVIDAVGASGQFVGETADIEAVVDNVLRSQVQFTDFYQTNIEGVQQLTSTLSQLSGAIKDIDYAKENIDKIGTVLGQFKESGAVGADMLEPLLETFGKLDSFQEFVDVMTDASSTIEQAQSASDALGTEWINQTGILDNLNEENAEAVTAMLQMIGVTNAAEAVERQLIAQKYNNLVETENLTDATRLEMEQILLEAGSCVTAEEKLKLLQRAQFNAKLAAEDLTTATSGSIGALLTQAKAAQASIKSINALSQVQTLFKAKENGTLQNYLENSYGRDAAMMYMTKAGWDSLIEKYMRDAQFSDEDLKVSVPTVSIDVPAISSTGTGNDKAQKEVEKYIADIDRLYKKREALNRQELTNNNLSDRISNTDDLRERIQLQGQYLQGLKNEQARLHDIAGDKKGDGEYDYTTARAEILENLNTLEKVYGITASYNPETNELLFDDLSQINKQIVDAKNYETDAEWMEARNDKVKAAEELVDTVIDQVDATKEWSEAWLTAQQTIRETNLGIIEDLKAIVEETSNAVDEIQGVYDTLQTAADEFEANDGFISVDTFQDIMSMGPEYLKYLTDENGLLVINREAINDVIKARTEQLAIENAMSYVERIRMALQSGAVESLDQLIGAQSKYNGTLWDTVYASLEVAKVEGLTDEQYAAAKHNIDVIYSLMTGVHTHLDEYSSDLENMQDATDKILQWTMDMLKKRVQDEIDDLEELKDKYSELIQARKDALDMAKEEDDYQDTVLEKTKKLAELQGQIDLLALDDSRDAQAKRQALMEEMADVQKELDETQRDHSIEQQKASLDQMQADYEAEKDDEIKVLEDSISSYQKIYDMAIDYIGNHWSTLKGELIDWNYEVGNTIEEEICGNWEKAIALMEKYNMTYGQLVAKRNADEYGFSGLGGGSSGSGTSGTSGSSSLSSTVATTSRGTTTQAAINAEKTATVSEKVYAMRELGKQWMKFPDQETRDSMHRQAAQIAKELPKYGVTAEFNGASGVWTITSDLLNPKNKGKNLYEVYHTGGIVGGGTVRENEQLALLQKGEPIISNGQKQTLFDLIDFMGMMRNKLTKADFTGIDLISSSRNRQMAELMSHAPSGGRVNIHFGDVTIYGGNDETVRKHQEISRQQANEVLKYLNVKK